ncbi:MAG: FtsX-like permease family protein [Bacteroidales bacterium]|nr:FtsX-like permease family protein [Bacteroidales bacterium]
MNLPFYIAKRYILGKKSHNAINIVSAISMGGVVFGTIAFVLILSVFNGFDQLVKGMYNSFYPDILVVAGKGKVFSVSEDTLKLIKGIRGVDDVALVLEDNALLVYNEKQTVGRVKGVSDNFSHITGIDSLIWSGENKLWHQSMPRAVIGRGLAYSLGVNPELYQALKIYVPRRNAAYSNDPNKSLNRKLTLVSGIFASQPDIDGKILLVPLEFARELFEYEGFVSALELKIDNSVSEKKVISSLKGLLGENFIVQDRFQQNELLYKTMKTEKWAIFLILAFVLIILLFSLVGSVSMLIIEKKKDISILYSLGANQTLVRRIFYREGLLITIAGLFIGLVLGSSLALLQEHFGFIKLNEGFVIDAYPVVVKWADLLVVSLSVTLIGVFSSWYPVKLMLRQKVEQVKET